MDSAEADINSRQAARTSCGDSSTSPLATPGQLLAVDRSNPPLTAAPLTGLLWLLPLALGPPSCSPRSAAAMASTADSTASGPW